MARRNADGTGDIGLTGPGGGEQVHIRWILPPVGRGNAFELALIDAAFCRVDQLTQAGPRVAEMRLRDRFGDVTFTSLLIGDIDRAQEHLLRQGVGIVVAGDQVEEILREP